MKLPIELSKDSREPIYHQIENQLKALIAGGQLAAGTSLPSIRALSKELEVSIITTRRAYQNLENNGFIRTAQGKGTFVAEIAAATKQQVKHDAVYQTMEDAVETALRYDYSTDQVEEIFHNIINTRKGD
ncbi:GntR family transcriptional regulator [Lentibacillus sp. CBA3610]|uniref:GntR family transcriptional regulator n=1 Tax=Lentibacillus sp. CBA3610 TaxID=2518176 RepID=UPI001595E816|nr:GntR family transcriptional regulator [Lentibacillus sp. CBA3610]QKY70608.1 GntR family transcriptional regulator [Lentibacillus sp. CBA3610]